MKTFQVVYGDVPEKITLCMESVRGFYPDVVIFKFDKVENPVKSSDLYRLEILMKHDDVLYIDWDVMLTGPLELINNGLPCCNYYKGQPDCSIIYSPDKKIWIDLETEREKRGMSNDVYGFIRKLLRFKNVNEIKGNYEHLRGEAKWK